MLARITDLCITRVVPCGIRNALLSRFESAGVKKYFYNTSWMMGGQLFSFAVSFFMVALVARYLGPENMGKLSYAQSFVAIFSMFASLGINQILFHDIVKYPEREQEIMGTAFVLKLLCGSLTMAVTMIAAFALNDDIILTFLIFILSLSFVMEPFGIISILFNARVQAKYTAIIKIVMTVVIPALKLGIIFLGKGIIFFAAIISLEIFLSVCLSLYFYFKIFKRDPRRWAPSLLYTKNLLKRSWPLLFAGVSGYLFARVDQIMLHQMINSKAVGLYQVSVSFTELAVGYVPGAIVASVMPAVINAKKQSMGIYITRLRQLIGLSTVTSLSIVCSVFLLSPIIVPLLYGHAFAESASILRIYVWASFLYMVMVIVQQHLINDNKTVHFFVFSLITAVCNVMLNLWFIPIWGPHGAAVATVVSYGLYLFLPLAVHSIRIVYFQVCFPNRSNI